MLSVALEAHRNAAKPPILDFYNGKLYKDVEILTFVPYIKADNEEADKLAGKYGSRSNNVAQCRQCEVPCR
jgi:hypothetical protein